jgi:hypothetical protein
MAISSRHELFNVSSSETTRGEKVCLCTMLISSYGPHRLNVEWLNRGMASIRRMGATRCA